MRILDRIREAIREQRYRVSSHANEEMSADGFEVMDIENIIMSGKVSRKFTHDPRGPRYQISGQAVDNRAGHVVCRFLLSGVLLIVTAFADEN